MIRAENLREIEEMLDIGIVGECGGLAWVSGGSRDKEKYLANVSRVNFFLQQI